MLYYTEIFASIQGEARNVGVPTTFVRLFGCPVGCTYCDTIQDPKERRKISIENVVTKVQRIKGIKNVCITGGEPLIYEEDLLPLVWELLYLDYDVEIETSGCIPIPYEDTPARKRFRYIMDIKCPSSGVPDKNVYENLLHLSFNDDVVFVIKDKTDYDFMKKVLKKYPTNARIYLSPMFKDDKPLIGDKLVKWMIEDRLDARISVQIHKFLEVK